MTRVLVTGANGFVGRRLVAHLAERGYIVRCAVRHLNSTSSVAQSDTVAVGDIGPHTDWQPALAGIEAVVHLAARAHLLNDRTADPLAEFRRVNTEGSLRLARQAAAAGVKRLVFISTIGVNGAETHGRAFTATDVPAPWSPYAVSKHEAELGLQALAQNAGLALTVIRPPLVYGPGAPGNFERLLRALHRGIPLPLASVRNRRSFIGVDNLADLIETCLRDARAAGKTFLASDGEDISTPDLLRRLGHALGRPARLWPCPPGLLAWAAAAAGRRSLAQQLCGSLQIDPTAAREHLGWTPQISLDDGLRRAAAPFRD